jgi:hypothetical protein
MNSVSFNEYKRLLFRLRWLQEEGKGDSEDADDLLDRLDGLWFTMSDNDRNLLDAVCNDLNLNGMVKHTE